MIKDLILGPNRNGDMGSIDIFKYISKKDLDFNTDGSVNFRDFSVLIDGRRVQVRFLEIPGWGVNRMQQYKVTGGVFTMSKDNYANDKHLNRNFYHVIQDLEMLGSGYVNLSIYEDSERFVDYLYNK